MTDIPELDLVALIDVLELIAPDAVATSITPMGGGVGGNGMDRVILQRGEFEIPFVVRRHLDPSITPEDTVRLAQCLESLRPTPVPAPELLWLDADGNTFGRPSLAMTHLAGEHGFVALQADPVAVATLLAEQIIAITWVAAPSLEHLPRPTTPTDLIAWFVGPVGDLPADDLFEGLAPALGAVAPAVPVLLHGDLHAGNLLIQDGQVTGIVDWDTAAVGDPRVDLAYAYVSTTLAVGPEFGQIVLDTHEALRGVTVDLDPFVRLALVRALSPRDVSWRRAWASQGLEVDAATFATRFEALRSRHG